MTQRLRESLTLLLIGLLPFHGLLVTVGTRVLRGPGHPPWGVLAIWKEALLGVILCIAILEILKRITNYGLRITDLVRLDRIDVLIFVLTVLSVVLSLYRPWMTLGSFALGFKYDLVPLLAFIVLRRVPWSDLFWMRAKSALLWVGGIVAVYGIATFFVPAHFFSFLGYSDAHSLYLPNAPLPAFQQISGSAIRRIQSTFSGPNQFGIWLLIPLSAVAAKITNYELRITKSPKSVIRNPKLLITGGILLMALLLTFSRSAWIAAFVILCAVAYSVFPRQVFKHALVGVVSLLVIVGVTASVILPSIFFRATSTWGHLVRPLQALHEMQRYPLGFGLGMAGPAANHTHEPCVYLPPGGDATWAKNLPQLCVFLGDFQAQPVDHQCNCALLPENWYLQIGVELGWIGFVLYLMLIGTVLWKLRITNFGLRNSAIRPSTILRAGNPQSATFLFFLGISIAALFLHAWEDSAVAYTAWVMLAASLQLTKRRTVSRPA